MNEPRVAASYVQLLFEHMARLGHAEALGTPPAQTWMVGDSRNDAEAARGAGCPVVLVTYGYNHGEDIRAVPALQHLERLDRISVGVRA